ncbi:MAG: hypothetical protein OEV00_13215 [Acidobacteriota bacterium]|nr:hypothetical protein [Acidobacteriota bacterium]
MSPTRVAAIWGFAEATLWFVVPDVLLSWYALDRSTRGYRASGAAVLGAMVGGVVMWLWGQAGSGAAYGVLDAIPGIQKELIESVRHAVSSEGLSSMVLGGFRGVPYKIYAVAWGELGGNLAAFVVLTVPARAIRFLLVTFIAGAICKGPLKEMTLRRRRMVHVGFWFVFYVGYFVVMG